jgi:hypothetical protein
MGAASRRTTAMKAALDAGFGDRRIPAIWARMPTTSRRTVSRSGLHPWLEGLFPFQERTRTAYRQSGEPEGQKSSPRGCNQRQIGLQSRGEG